MIRTVKLGDHAYRRHWRRRLVRALTWTVLSGGWLWWRAARIVLEVARRAPSYADADYWLVPGFRLEGDEVTRFFELRLRRVGRLWQPAQRWCLSGHAVDEHSQSEALAGLTYLRDHGLPAGALVTLDHQARDSAENLQHLPADWPNDVPIGLVSNRWHLARCAWLAEALGLQVKICAAERRWRPRLPSWLMVAREALALLSWTGPAIRQVSAEALLPSRHSATAGGQSPMTSRKFLTP